MENQNSIKDIINNAMQDIRTILDTDTIIGEQIHLDNGITIIPISKVSMGFASGGLDLPVADAEGRKNFGGGGGTGVTFSPIGFLTVYPEGKVEIIPVTPTEMGPVEQITDMIGKAPEIIARIRAAFVGEEAEHTEESELTFDTEEDDKANKKSAKKKKEKKK